MDNKANTVAARPRPARGLELDATSAAALEVLESRWTLRLLTVLSAGPARFSELETAVPGVSRPMLSERLRTLEAAGLVRRTVAAGPPITSTYTFIGGGDGLADILRQLHGWATRRPLRPAS